MTPAAAELAIRQRRLTFNRAIAQGDAALIASMLTRDCIMVTGTDSAVIAGRMAQVKVWKREFAALDRDVYVRTPDRFDVSAVEPIAMEHGNWKALKPNGAPTAGGTYAAKWRQLQGDWVLEAEVFITLA